MNLFKTALVILFFWHLNAGLIAQNVRVIFINKTGKTLDSLTVNGVLVGQLKPDSLSKVVNFEYLAFDSSGEELRGIALLDKQRVLSWPDFVFCGSGPYEIVRQGNFLYHIKPVNIDSRHYIIFEVQR